VTRPPRILVVDDNQTLRALLAQALEAAGYVAIPAESAELALEVFRLDPPDLCLVDHHMPGMDGADLIRWLRRSSDARLRAMPAIGLTGYQNAGSSLLEAGASAALQKPCDEGALLELVARALAASTLRSKAAPPVA
jgi:two-component system NtrC family sensor kinase